MGWNAPWQLDCAIFKSTKSPAWNDELSDFVHVDANSWKFKVDLKLFAWAWSEMCVTILVQRVRKLAVLQKGTLVIGIHFMQGWAATLGMELQKKEKDKNVLESCFEKPRDDRFLLPLRLNI